MMSTFTRNVMVLCSLVILCAVDQASTQGLVCTDTIDQESVNAIKHGDNARIARLLTEMCRSQDRHLRCQPTLLHLVVRSGDIEVVKFLLDEGFDVDANHERAYERYTQQYPLFLSCLNRIGTPLSSAADQEKWRVPHVMSPKWRHMSGESRLELQSRLIELLLKSGADLNPTGVMMPPLVSLLWASQSKAMRNIDAIRILLQYGADPKIAFKFARDRNDKELLEVVHSFCRNSGRC